MKNILLVSAFLTLALCSAFSYAYYQKTTTPKPIVELEEPPPMDNYNDAEWEEYHRLDESAEKVTDASFKKLLEQFPKGNLPLNLSAVTLRNQLFALDSPSETDKTNRKVLPRVFRSYFPNLDDSKRFSRMPAPLGEPFMRFEAEDKHVLVYFTRRSSYYYYALLSGTKIDSGSQAKSLG